MADQWLCPQCQHTNAGDTRFCPHCGAANPAFAAPTAGPGRDKLAPPGRLNRRLLWAAAIGLWVIGCAVLAAGGWVWWSRQGRVNEVASVAEAITTPPEATSLPSPTLTPTSTPLPPTATPQPATPTPTPRSETGDTLALPTATSAPTTEGMILFLSSRDHDSQTEPGPPGPAQNRHIELYAMEPDGSRQTRLSNGNQDWWNGNASLTPYYKPNHVVVNGRYVFDLTTMQVVDELTLEFPNPNSSTPLSADHFPVWSPSGEIVFTNASAGGHSIYYLDRTQGEPLKLTAPPNDAWGDGFPVLSPDGEWIVFMRNWFDKAQDGLWLMRLDGSEVHRIMAGQYNVPRRAFWSPDGSKLAFEGPKLNATTFSFEVWVSEADGSNPRQLTSFPESLGAWEPKWSPDGQRIVFNVGDSARGQIFIIDADGGGPQQLTTIGDANLAPLWLPLSSDEILIASANDTTSSAIPASFPTPTPQSIAAAPTSTPVTAPNCPSPGVQIISPRPGTRFTQRYNYIVGTANIPRFHHWKIEYSTNPNGGWMYLLERDYPVDNDKLIMLDTSTVPRGPYGLRLTVVDETGNYPEPCVVWYTNGY
jgi:hypothetical protein